MYQLRFILLPTVTAFIRRAHRAWTRNGRAALLRLAALHYTTDLWSPNSPDSDPVDYKICAVLLGAGLSNSQCEMSMS